MQRAFQRQADHLSILAVRALLEDVVSDHHFTTVGQIDRPAVVAVQTGDDVVLDDGAPCPALQAVAGTGGREDPIVAEDEGFDCLADVDAVRLSAKAVALEQRVLDQ